MRSITNRAVLSGGTRGSVRGSILVPCLFILSLISLLTLGILNIGGLGTNVSGALAEKSQARLAAMSGIEIAYERLTADPEYGGDNLDGSDGFPYSLKIKVEDLGNSEYEILSRGSAGMSECLVRSRARLQPWLNDYPLCIGGNVRLLGDARVMGTTYVSGTFYGKPFCKIYGDVHLRGDRDILYDLNGDAIMIDGLPIPEVVGEIFTNAEVLSFPGVTLESLRAMAVAEGHFYTSTQHFVEKDLEGVYYFEGELSKPFFENVTLKGVLVCHDVAEIRTEAGYFKVRSDDSICPNVAILAPGSNLWVDPAGLLDVFGLTLVAETDIQGRATFTGPLIASGDLYARPDSHLYLQCPTYMQDFISEYFEWSEIRVIELEYEEL